MNREAEYRTWVEDMRFAEAILMTNDALKKPEPATTPMVLR
jgi:hypothetical protein